MAFFKKKTEEKKDSSTALANKHVQTDEETPKKMTSVSTSTLALPRNSSGVLKAPRITEKATFAAENGVYVFEIDLRATKKDVALAVESLYKVKPVKVNIVKIPSKKVPARRRGTFGSTSKGKKAYVYLKKGETIEIV
jgi:large subunit ribosomal protein L23